MSATPITVAAERDSQAARSAARTATPGDGEASPAQRLLALANVLRERSAALLPYLDFAVQRLGRSGIVGLTLLVFSAVFVLSANSPLRAERSELLATLGPGSMTALRAGRAAATPGAQLDAFLRSLPRPSDLPRVTEKLYEEARAAGIELESGTYELLPAHGTRLARYRISYPVTGTYPAVRHFIDGSLVAMPAVELESFKVERQNVGEQRITADLTFVVVLRNER